MTLHEIVAKRYGERFRNTQEIIINGVQSFEEYRFHIGYLRGMWDLIADIEPLLKDPESANDGEE